MAEHYDLTSGMNEWTTTAGELYPLIPILNPHTPNRTEQNSQICKDGPGAVSEVQLHGVTGWKLSSMG